MLQTIISEYPYSFDLVGTPTAIPVSKPESWKHFGRRLSFGLQNPENRI
jgi:hypothetical protein